ncbi:hypothetical protein QUA41_30560 [Microcoleus sp. Pol11C1]|uniref:hypothetical protein n=1 Tax=unclassified Microcoleus TaxID=2642155 RepID=UPI002FD58188
MKPENIYALSELSRSLTPFGLIAASLIVVGLAVNSSEKLVGDRFVYVIGIAGTFLGAAAGGYSPQQRQQPQNRIDADRVDIDQSK